MTHGHFEPWTDAELAERFGVPESQMERARALAPFTRRVLAPHFLTSAPSLPSAPPAPLPTRPTLPVVPKPTITAAPSRSAENEGTKMNSHKQARARDMQKGRPHAHARPPKPSAASTKPAPLNERQVQKILADAKRQLQAFGAPVLRSATSSAKSAAVSNTSSSARAPSGADMDRAMGLDRSRDGVHRNEHGAVCFSTITSAQAAARCAELDREALSRVMTLAESDAHAKGKYRVPKSSLVSAAHMRPNAAMDHAMRHQLGALGLTPKRVVYRDGASVRFSACTADEARALLAKKKKEMSR